MPARCAADGMLVFSPRSGKKSDVWYAIDPDTGEKLREISTSGIQSMCPVEREDKKKVVYLGRKGS